MAETEIIRHHYTLTEYEQGKPCVIVSTSRGSVELPIGDDFNAWAREQWPDHKRFKVDQDREPFRWAGRS